MIWLAGWTVQEFIVFLGTTAIVVGLCNLSFGDKSDDAHLSRLVDDEPDDI
jgi:ABC-type uncharacterized transport system permease subunit